MGSARGNWDPLEGQQPFRPNPNGAGDRTTTLRRLLIGAGIYLKLCGRSGRNCPFSPPVLSGYNGSPDTRFSRGTTQLMSLPDGERCLCPPQSLVVSLLLSLVPTLVLSRTGGVLSLQSILTHRFPQFPLRNLCSLVMLAVSSLVFAAMDTAFF